MTGHLTVREVMDASFVTFRPEMTIDAAIGILMEERITGAAVIDDDNHILGLLSEKNCLMTLLRESYDGMPAGFVSEYMSDDYVTVRPNMDIFELADLFLKHVIRRFFVVDHDKLIGQVTRRDLLRAIQGYMK